MAMMYPEVSPTAPVSREDLAAILAMQGISAGADRGASQSSQSMADLLGGTPTGANDQFGTGAPPANSNPDDTGSDRASMAASMAGMSLADMTTSNASMVTDSGGRTPMGGAPPGEGFDTDLGDQAGLNDIGPGFVGGSAFTAANTPGAPMTSGSFADRWGGITDFPGPPADAPVTPSSTFADRWGGMPTGTPLAITVTPNTVLPEQVVTAPALPTGRAPLASPGRTPGAPVDAPDFVSPGYDLGSPAPGGTDFGQGDFGGFTSGSGNTGGFGAGYSGSADMGNTQGAAGFTAGAPGGGFDVGAGSFSGGGAVGGFGGTDAGAGDGAGAGAGAGTGSGNDSGSDGASGGVG
jgi:hypothetical protein